MHEFKDLKSALRKHLEGLICNEICDTEWTQDLHNVADAMDHIAKAERCLDRSAK